ncbi:biotin carboxylase N-terminal domain-containing protein [Rhodococcus sp. NPDC059968]|uniref:biotin carboxylase N-terminal domain-containing protein n=1 Tax=Rhodococcus sp. NPDC059968 TaxID=3347017 RepID=UPI00366CA37B
MRAYLSVDEIVGAARRAGADVVYSGYGFLSENPDLAATCAAEGITFICPSTPGASRPAPPRGAPR